MEVISKSMSKLYVVNIFVFQAHFCINILFLNFLNCFNGLLSTILAVLNLPIVAPFARAVLQKFGKIGN